MLTCLVKTQIRRFLFKTLIFLCVFASLRWKLYSNCVFLAHSLWLIKTEKIEQETRRRGAERRERLILSGKHLPLLRSLRLRVSCSIFFFFGCPMRLNPHETPQSQIVLSVAVFWLIKPRSPTLRLGIVMCAEAAGKPGSVVDDHFSQVRRCRRSSGAHL